jgi:UPF0755 protein
MVPSKKWKWLLAPVAVLVFGAASAWFFIFRPNVSSSEKTYLDIPDHAGWSFVVQKLCEQGSLHSLWSFRMLAERSGYAADIKPGRYALAPGMSNMDVLKMLVSGRQEEVRVVIRSGWTKEQLTAYVSTHLNTDSQALASLLNGSGPLVPEGWNKENILAAFIPNTYFFYWNTSPEKFIGRLLKEHEKFWNGARLEKAHQLGLDPVEVSILASIVEKETNKTEEMPLIAGVYLNRLKINMALQADPTVKYALGDPEIRRISRKMTEHDSPYNTYRNTGLPPGPICLPGIQAIEAVLNYSRHNYLYFCAREDFSGYHSFAASYAEHLQNSRKYQAELNKRGIR